jgi:tetratricopeptide (TPR) repeat protein
MRIGPYEVASTLGQGGMGVVYAARAPGGRDVAVKVLRRNEGEVLARFERERRLLASLGEAEGFVALLDTGVAAQGPYLVMPLVAGGTLRKKLDAGPLGVDETIALGRALARALGGAHARGIVHRDMKPENILFTLEGLPLVADLGLAKHFDPGAPGASQSVVMSRHGDLRGTAGYMAPEQMTDARSVGPAADVFSLGAILYECLAGRPPFVGENALAVLTKVSDGRFEPLRGQRPGVPAWLGAAIERALANAVEDRFQDGLALGRALAGGPGRRRAAAPAILAGAAVLVLAGALAAGAMAPGSRRDRELAHASARFNKHDWDGAIEGYTKAIALDPTVAAAWFYRGAARMYRGDPDAAIADYSRAIELAPEHAEAWLNRGVERGMKGDHDGARADLDRAIELDPRIAVAWCSRGLARDRKGDRIGAMADVARAIELDPKLATAIAQRGVFKSDAGDQPGAIADLDRAIELDPKLAVAWCNRGFARGKAGDPEGAIADVTRAIALDPKLVRAWCNRAMAKREAGDLDGSIADYTRAIELDPKNPLVWFDRACSKARRSDVDGAIDDYTRSIELDPKSASAWSNRGATRGSKGDLDGAIADLTRAIELDPKNADLWWNRAAARCSKGDYVGAADDDERFLELAPGDARAPSCRAEIERLRATPGKR